MVALSIQPSYFQSLCPLVLDRSNFQHLDGQSPTEEIISEIDWACFIDPDALESSVVEFATDVAIFPSQDISMVDTLGEFNHDLIEDDISATRDENDKTIGSQGTENETFHTSEPMTMLPESPVIAGKVAVAQTQVEVIVLSSDDEVDQHGAHTTTFGLLLQPTHHQSPDSRRREKIKRPGFVHWKDANKLLRQQQHHRTPAKLRKVEASPRSSERTDDDDEFEVKKILGVRRNKRGEIVVRAHWAGYPSDRRWYPIDDFTGAFGRLRHFYMQSANQKKPKPWWWSDEKSHGGLTS